MTQTTNSNALGLETPPAADIETTPEHYNLIGGDPVCAGWTRSYDDPNDGRHDFMVAVRA